MVSLCHTHTHTQILDSAILDITLPLIHTYTHTHILTIFRFHTHSLFASFYSVFSLSLSLSLSLITVFFLCGPLSVVCILRVFSSLFGSLAFNCLGAGR